MPTEKKTWDHGKGRKEEKEQKKEKEEPVGGADHHVYMGEADHVEVSPRGRSSQGMHMEEANHVHEEVEEVKEVCLVRKPTGTKGRQEAAMIMAGGRVAMTRGRRVWEIIRLGITTSPYQQNSNANALAS